MSGDMLSSDMVLSFFGLDGHGHPAFTPELEMECDLVLVKSLRFTSLSHLTMVPSTSSPGCIRELRLCIHVNLFLIDRNIALSEICSKLSYGYIASMSVHLLETYMLFNSENISIELKRISIFLNQRKSLKETVILYRLLQLTPIHRR